MSHFNLIDEKWIPVRLLAGGLDELGIRDTLLRAKEIEHIEDQSPLVVAALHRFLLAVLYRALKGPTDIDQAKILFDGGLPEDKVTSYLNEWYERFWLFDDEFPFGQNPHVPENHLEPWTKLTAEHNAKSNKVLFDHTNALDPGEKNLKECSRWLLATMSFSISGGRGYYPSPSPNAMICIPLGRNLEESLCYNLVPYPNKEVMHADLALWERDPRQLPLPNSKQSAAGYADLYTWQSRMIHFEKCRSGNICTMRFVAGQGFENPSSNPDPMQPFRADKNRGKLPIQFREDRGTWRDFDSLLPDSSGLSPLTVQNSLKISGYKKNCIPKSIMVLGLRYTPPSANVDFWRMEKFILPEALCGKRDVRAEIQQLLKDAEDAYNTLRLACRSYSRYILSKGDRMPDTKDITGYVDQMSVLPLYWSALESCFHAILGMYTLEKDSEDILRQWLSYVRETLGTAWEQHRASVSMGDAWSIRALAKSEGPVLHKLKNLKYQIDELQP